jgi:hypothetical protein
MPLNDIDYSQSMIYRIVPNDTNLKFCYIGSTTNFTKRKSRHKYICNNKNNKHYNINVYKTIRDYGGWDAFSMVLVEPFACNNNRELEARERYWYDYYSSFGYLMLNKQVPNRSHNEYNLQRLTCECGIESCNRNIANHRKTKRHQDLILKQQSINQSLEEVHTSQEEC